MDGGWQLAVLGLLMLGGYAADLLGRHTHVPRVTLLLLLGLLAGPEVLGLAPPEVRAWFPMVTHMALAIVGFLLGESFAGKHLKQGGKAAVIISLAVVCVTATVVFAALVSVGVPSVLALLLAGIAPATAPAATLDVVRESNAKGPLTDTLLEVVAIDDAWGVMLFSLLLVIASHLSGQEAGGGELLVGLWEVLGAGLLGALLAVPMAWVTGREGRGEPTLVEAVGFVFLCGGLAELLDVSYLLACIVLGATLANRARHYTRPFHAIERVREPFLIVFFVLAGFELDLAAAAALSVAGGVYVVARAFGKVCGGAVGARLAGAPPALRDHIGWCLLPQAGVALGLALLAAERVPEAAPALQVIIASTVLFEIVGPMATVRALRRAGEAN